VSDAGNALGYVLRTFGKLPGVVAGEVEQEQDSAHYRVGVFINDVCFFHRWSYAEIEREKHTPSLTEVLGRPMKALRTLFDDGIEAGRKKERESEIRALKERQENAYRSLRQKAMADAWNAVAAAAAK
jgi:hypothetical protein